MDISLANEAHFGFQVGSCEPVTLSSLQRSFHAPSHQYRIQMSHQLSKCQILANLSECELFVLVWILAWQTWPILGCRSNLGLARPPYEQEWSNEALGLLYRLSHQLSMCPRYDVVKVRRLS